MFAFNIYRMVLHGTSYQSTMIYRHSDLNNINNTYRKDELCNYYIDFKHIMASFHQ